MNSAAWIRWRDELGHELTDNILAYWMTHLPDEKKGGFHGHVTHTNQAVEGAPRGAIQNARILWTFAAAYRSYRKQAYIDMAVRAYDYITARFLDGAWGGVFWELDANGRVTAPRKQIYAIAFTVYAMAEYHLATGKEEPLLTARRLYSEIETHAFDRELNGYTEALGRKWEPIGDLRLSEKDENESKTMNTHLHVLEAYTHLYRAWKDPGLEASLKNLVELFLERFIDPHSHHLRLFFDDHWNLKSSLVSYGHDIECSWLLHEASVVLGNQGLIDRAEKSAVAMARATFGGLDGDGGLFYEFFPEEGRYDSDKHWWPQAEAMVGFFNAFQITGEEEFLAKCLESWNFIRTFLVDREFGEWFWSVDRNGYPQTQKEKAGFWKCPYHNGRACLEMMHRIDEVMSSA
jgi:mannobiose 2-epimerase